MHGPYGPDFGVMEHQWRGTVPGTFLGFPGHGRCITLRLLHIWEFRTGRMRRENVWLDGARIATRSSRLSPSARPPSATDRGNGRRDVTRPTAGPRRAEGLKGDADGTEDDQSVAMARPGRLRACQRADRDGFSCCRAKPRWMRTAVLSTPATWPRRRDRRWTTWRRC